MFCFRFSIVVNSRNFHAESGAYLLNTMRTALGELETLTRGVELEQFGGGLNCTRAATDFFESFQVRTRPFAVRSESG